VSTGDRAAADAPRVGWLPPALGIIDSFVARLQPQAPLLFGIRRRGTLLDVGCGAFERVHRFVGRRRPDLTIVGIERYDGASIYGPLPPAPHRGGAAAYRRYVCDIETESLPFEADSFDGVYFAHVIEHLTNKSRALAEIHRVLRPGSLLYVETPGPASKRFRRPPWMAPDFGGTISYDDDATHLGEPYTKDALGATLREAGFEPLRVGTFRQLGPLGMPVYAALATLGLLPLPNRHLRSTLFGAGVRDLIGFGIYGIARKIPG
jgi:SAM-dependent methyltransferase